MDHHDTRVTATIGQDCRFPSRLHQLLESTEKANKSHIVLWLPGGKSFMVHDKAAFANKALPLFFGTSKYRSFQRNLNLWGFHTVPKGPEKGRCSHPRFQKEFPDLCYSMERAKMKVTAAMSASIASATTENEGLHGSINSPGQPRDGAEDSSNPQRKAVHPISAAYSSSPMQAGQPIPPSTGYIGTTSHLRPAGFNPLIGSNNRVGNTRSNPIDLSNLAQLINDINVLNALGGFSPVDDNFEMTRLSLGTTTMSGQSFSLNEILYQTNNPLVPNCLPFFPVANNTGMLIPFLASSRSSWRGTAAGGNTAPSTAAEDALRYLLNLPFSLDDNIL
jgi:hypothetical protein